MWMYPDLVKRAIKLSYRGYPAPNPHVGCVIARDRHIVGEGYHAFAGGPHAEIVALEQAGSLARGADVYVTLEPCNHHGRTPPCSEALIAAGVKRVSFCTRDPNEAAQGGARRLEQAGIEIDFGLFAAKARVANEAWLTAMELKRPYVVAKAAVSMDGRIALPSGESQWITGERARREGHKLRARCGVVLVGRRTVETDDPHLTARVPGVRNPPLRVVLDSKNRLGPGYRVFDDAAETWHLTSPDGEWISPREVLDKLWAAGHTSVLIEGGAATLREFLMADLVDRIEIFQSARPLGDGPTWVSDLKLSKLEDAMKFRVRRVKLLNEDIWLTFVRSRPGTP